MLRAYVPAALEAALWALLGAAILYPLGAGLADSIATGGFEVYGEAFRGRALTLLARSAAMAAGAAALALAAGVPVGLAIARTDARARGALRALYAATIFLPPALAATGWVSLLGNVLPRTPAAAAGVLAATHLGFVVVLVERGAAAIDRETIEAALLEGGPLAASLRIDLPLARRHIAAAALLVFLLAFRNYAVPSLLGVSAYPEEIFVRYATYFDHPRALALSAPCIGLAALALAARAGLGKAPIAVPSGGPPPPLYRRGRGRAALAAALALPLIPALAVPLVGPFRSLGSLEASLLAIRDAWPALRASLATAGAAAAGAALLALPWGFGIARRSGAGGLVRELVAVLPFALPPVVVAVCLVAAWNRIPTRGILDHPSIIALAHAAIFLPFALEPTLADIARIDRETLEAAALEPGSRLRRWLAVIVPRVPALPAGALLVFALSFGELEAGLLLAPPGVQTLMARIHNLAHFDAREDVAALTILTVLLIGLPLAALAVSRGIRPRRSHARPHRAR